MLDGIKKNSDIFAIMATAELYDFKLTGSRAIQDRTDSDWDYFVKDSPGVEDFLFKSGFRILPCSDHYRDSSIIRVWRYLDSVSGLQVDVQVVHQSWYAAKCNANEVWKKIGHYFQTKDKTERRMLWNSLMDLPIPVSVNSIDESANLFRKMLAVNKIALIKGLRDAFPGLGLKEAKERIDDLLK